MRTWVIPDVHGNLLTLRSLIEEKICLRLDDKLIFLGDLVDRGNDSKGVLDYVMDLQAAGYVEVVLRGNHEDFMVKAYREEKAKSALRKVLGTHTLAAREWFMNGGKPTVASFGVSEVSDIPEKYINWIEEMKFYWETEKFIFVHAGLNFKNEDIFSDTSAMMWARDYQVDLNRTGGRRVVHGHTPVALDLIGQLLEKDTYPFIDLDNGVYLTNSTSYGYLVAMETGTMEYHIQPNIDNDK